MGVVLTPSPGTDSVVPYFAVVNGLAAGGILCMDVGTFLHQDFDTAQQALAGCQMQRCGAIARLTVEDPAREKRGERKDEGHQIGGQTSSQACCATSPLGDPGTSLPSVPQFQLLKEGLD